MFVISSVCTYSCIQLCYWNNPGVSKGGSSLHRTSAHFVKQVMQLWTLVSFGINHCAYNPQCKLNLKQTKVTLYKWNNIKYKGYSSPPPPPPPQQTFAHTFLESPTSIHKFMPFPLFLLKESTQVSKLVFYAQSTGTVISGWESTQTATEIKTMVTLFHDFTALLVPALA